jgi:importin-5
VLQDDPLWHSADTESAETEGEGPLYETGQECLDRIALSLGGNTVVPLASQTLPKWIVDPDWRKRHAALICLAQIAEGCVKVMQNQLDGLVDLCMRVRAGCIWPPTHFNGHDILFALLLL